MTGRRGWCLGCGYLVIALGVREMWTDLRFFVEVNICCRWSRSGEITVKEVKQNSQGFGLISWVDHDAIYQEEGKNQEFLCECVQFEIPVGLSNGEVEYVFG